jgi:hypothetical protein
MNLLIGFFLHFAFWTNFLAVQAQGFGNLIAGWNIANSPLLDFRQ